MTTSPPVGLRERKREQTSQAIHIAAAELVLEHGLDAVTIDAISERADVSTRTFFNYFPSKEDAVLGIDEVAASAELEKPRDYAGDPFLAAFDLIHALFEASGAQRTKSDLKRDVLRKYPHLMVRQMVRVAALEDQLSEIVAGWLASDERFAAETEAERLEEARIILGVCLATVRVSMKKWASDTSQTGGPLSADPRKSYERSITTLRTVLEKLK